MEYIQSDGLEFLSTVSKEGVDLVLTDPPYITSRKTGMNTQMDIVKKVETTGESVYKEDDWIKYLSTHPELSTHSNVEKIKQNYIRYGSIYGKKYAVKTDYGDWDKNFTLELLEKFVKEFYRILRKGGTCIIFFDVWKISYLSDIMKCVGFKQLRIIQWIKTNPQPLNSRVNYLTNALEIAVLGVKGSKPTFNSQYDNGIYKFPLQGGKHRFHPTQKNQILFEELIKKHSNEGDLVLDPFLGSGTTLFACQSQKRIFKGCDYSKEYIDKISERLKSEKK